ncbi:MAG: hypothetical protein WCP00_02000 [bacterium]|jgi:hypothetical protein|nr:hypothetical protein [bacterium]
MDDLINKLEKKYSKIKFEESDKFYWSPSKEIVYYNSSTKDIDSSKWALLHEVGHALLQHKGYDQDFILLRMEVLAWEKAKKISKKFSVKIDEDHIQDCLDTYRDWIYKRSLCPKCSTISLQNNKDNKYRCFNCSSVWQVTSSKFCRPYRTLVK